MTVLEKNCCLIFFCVKQQHIAMTVQWYKLY